MKSRVQEIQDLVFEAGNETWLAKILLDLAVPTQEPKSFCVFLASFHVCLEDKKHFFVISSEILGIKWDLCCSSISQSVIKYGAQ